MKTFRPGLRTQILLSLTLLLVAAMTLTSFVIARVTERDLLRYKAADGKAVVERMQAAVDEASREQSPPPLELIKERIQRGAAWMAPSGLFEQIVVKGKDGALWVGNQAPSGHIKADDLEIALVLRAQKGTARMSRDRGLFIITSPLFAGGQCIAAVQVPVRIDRMVQGLERSQQLIWFYIGLNVLVLLVFGTYLLSRIVIRPIKRLVKTADHFEDTEVFSPGTDTSRNEIAHLTISLHRMLKRLAENKEQMEAQILSLEKANQELKEAREEVLRSAKLSSLGRLAAGVAHEVGNPIGSILGYTDLLTARVEQDTESQDYLTRIKKEITRIDTIVRDLLDFSRSSPSEPTSVDVNVLVSEAASFFSHQKVMASVDLETCLGENVGMVWADPDQLKQVLVNLLLNACDALNDRGNLSIATTRIPCLEVEKVGSGQQQAEVIQIAVSDTGKGIPTSELNKIFDPFYTTKPPGKGTGLGLPISLRIVESFGGSISVESIEGKGATFTIRLDPWEPKHDT